MKAFISVGYIVLIGLIATNVQALTEEERAILEKKVIASVAECIKTYPLSMPDIYSFKNKIFPDGDIPKCFGACVFKTIGIMDENGYLAVEETQKKAELLFKDNTEQLALEWELLKICSAVNDVVTADGQEGCDRAKLIYECIVENGPRYGIKLDF